MPEWMESWLKASFYDVGTCRVHNSKHKPIFCGVCMGKPYCALCWRAHERKNHKHHKPIIRVRRASRRDAIGTKQMEKLWPDVSGIEVYSINAIKIFHLHPNPNSDTTTEENRDSRCETCTRKLKSNSYNCFCSIACKYKNNRLREGGELVEMAPATAKSLRKRKRKGTPTRAPRSSDSSGWIDVQCQCHI